jgi:hypothetical protein
LGIEDLLATECQQLVGQARGSLPGFANLGEQLTTRRVAKVDQRHVGTAIDDGEQVVEVVGDAAGQLPDGL